MSARRVHVVPTHIKVPEIMLSVAGFNLSVRQFLLLLMGLAVGYQLWSAVNGLAALPAFAVMRWVVAAIPVVLALVCAFVRLAGRALDAWGVVLLRYLLRPRRMVWRSVRFAEPLAVAGLVEEEGAA